MKHHVDTHMCGMKDVNRTATVVLHICQYIYKYEKERKEEYYEERGEGMKREGEALYTHPQAPSPA